MGDEDQKFEYTPCWLIHVKCLFLLLFSVISELPENCRRNTIVSHVTPSASASASSELASYIWSFLIFGNTNFIVCKYILITDCVPSSLII